jgi:hypothetical protein
MPDFRLYRLTVTGEVELPHEEFFATSDEAAVHWAARQNCPHGCEVWSRDRLIAVVTHKPDKASANEDRPSRWRRLARAAHLPGL